MRPPTFRKRRKNVKEPNHTGKKDPQADYDKQKKKLKTDS
jgi:hypothetical protein